MPRSPDRSPGKLDDAARAAWLYYVAGNTQDEVAEKMRISRPAAQRLISLAMRERLIKFRLDHPIGLCMMLAENVMTRFGIDSCEVVPTDPAAGPDPVGVAEVAAADIEKWLSRTEPTTIAFGTGRTLRAVADQLITMDAGQHRIVSMVGNIAPDGSASAYDVIALVAERVAAPHFPLPVPVIASSEEEKHTLHALSSIRHNVAMAQAADVAYVGVGQMGPDAPMLADGFLSDAEVAELNETGAAGEIIGWIFDDDGKLLNCATNTCVVSVPLNTMKETRVIAVTRGLAKRGALRAALKGGLVNGLITDEEMARSLLE